MPRCELTGKKPVSKNLVSHSNIKTKSRSYPNVQLKTFHSPSLKRSFRLHVAASTLRSIDKAGGIDVFLIQRPRNVLSPFALRLRKRLENIIHKERPKTSEEGAVILRKRLENTIHKEGKKS